MGSFYENKRILITGGTGSIGSEIVKQLIPLKPEVLRVFSRDETEHYLLRERLDQPKCLRLLVGDVRDRYRLRRALEGVHLVFHTAALKHVPSCEYNPFEAVQTNVVGTQNLIDAALDEGVERIVAMSTDKAVDPAFTMGATKLLAEKIVVATQVWSRKLKLACVRFGNVLGSRGSVVPLVREQVLRRKEITITDPKMTRFVMTIGEAARLTMRAMELMEGGEVFILKSMASVTVEDLVHAIVEETVAAHSIDPKSIRFKTIWRPGEKTHHRLFADEELSRVEKREDMFVVRHPSLDVEGAKARVKVARRMYLSESARPRGKEWIRKLLREERLV